MTTIKIVEAVIYVLGAFGIGAALAGIYSVCRAFVRKQNRLLEERFAEKHDEFLNRKKRVDAALKKN